MEGCDYSYSRPDPEQLRSHGIRFACRYLSYVAGKNLTRSEAERLNAAGIAVVSNWENKAGDQKGGYSAGVRHAREADRQHRACGAPPSRPIYFSTDWDASTAELATCYEYLKGCASVIGWSRVGCYGGYRTISYMHKRGVQWLWSTYAWSSGRVHAATNIYQYRNNVRLAGGYIDHNRSMTADFGAWTVDGPVGQASVDPFLGLSKGARGERVKGLQYMLRRVGYDVEHVTGEYDTKTASQVYQLTKKAGYNITSGDEITPEFVEALYRTLTEKLSKG